MKINIKTLKGETFEVEVQESETIGDLKRAIEAARPEMPAASLKLIHVGKIPKDDETVGSVHVKPTECIVAMLTKAKPPASSGAPSAPEPTPAPAAAAGPGPAATPAPAGETGGQTAGEDASAQAAANVVSGEGMNSAVEQLVAMGFPPEEVRKCLGAAFGNPDRAVEYLMGGIPEGVLAEMQGGAAPPAQGGQAPPAGGAPPPGPGSVQPAAPGRARVELPPELAAIRNNPQFTQLAGMIAQNPEMIGQVMPALAQSHPEIAEAIRNNPQAFTQMIQEVILGAQGTPQDPVAAMMQAAQQGGGGGGGGGHPPGTVAIHLTQEERDACERLQALGFDRNMVLQAYLACDKNEELAANYLFDNADDAMQD